MKSERLIELKHYVNNLLEREDICGAVITHGTDSLEETAYFLDLTITSIKPVIVTGAMRSSSELGYDGPSNLSAAVCTAISDDAIGKGVLIVLNNEVLLASEATMLEQINEAKGEGQAILTVADATAQSIENSIGRSGSFCKSIQLPESS